MNSLTVWRQRYAWALVIGILGVFLFVTFQSLSAGVARFENNLYSQIQLVSSFTKLRLQLGDRVFTEAVRGKDGWLHYSAESNLDDYQNALAFSPVPIQKNAQLLYNELQARHITLLIVIAPNKATIYPDTVPDEIQKINQQSRLDALVSYFNQYGPPVLIDLRPALQKASKSRKTYYKTDTHWNSFGGFVAYTGILDRLSGPYPELTPHKLSDFRLSTKAPKLMDISHILGDDSALESSVTLIPKFKSDIVWTVFNGDPFPARMSQTPDAHLPRLLIYFDSFGLGLFPFLTPHFREALFIANRSRYPDLDTIKSVDDFQPDIVIIEFAERNIAELNSFLANYVSKIPAK